MFFLLKTKKAAGVAAALDESLNPAANSALLPFPHAPQSHRPSPEGDSSVVHHDHGGG
jgi:hypothetical protein